MRNRKWGVIGQADRIADLRSGIRFPNNRSVLLRDESHSDPNFLLVLFDYRLQERDQLLLFVAIVSRLGYIPADFPHEFHVVHECPPHD
jgi:hypothetical protein